MSPSASSNMAPEATHVVERLTAIPAIEKFSGHNFHLWKFKMQMLLEERDLWDIVTGEESEPESKEGKAHQAWCKRSRKALATLCLNLADNQLSHIRSAKTPQEAWKKLGDIHETKSLVNRLFLRRQFFTAKMEDDEGMLLYITRVKTMAEKLEDMGAGVKEEDIVMTVLSGLPEDYNGLILALESRSDTLNLEYDVLERGLDLYGL
jgi:hypothetical protein